MILLTKILIKKIHHLNFIQLSKIIHLSTNMDAWKDEYNFTNKVSKLSLSKNMFMYHAIC